VDGGAAGGGGTICWEAGPPEPLPAPVGDMRGHPGIVEPG
jgi:hypothetical protein